MRANHKPKWVSVKTGRGTTEVQVGTGQFIFGRLSAAKELRMNQNTVWKRMQKLKNMQNCNIESNSHYSMITIINWDGYQRTQKISNIEGNTQVTPKCQASNTNKNDKNVKNDKKEPPLPPAWIDPEIWQDYQTHRKSIKKPFNVKYTLARLARLKAEGNDPNEVMAQSIASGWQGLFAVKDNGNKADLRPTTYAQAESAQRQSMARELLRRKAVRNAQNVSGRADGEIIPLLPAGKTNT
jgi:hypothetical protein